MTAVQFSSSEKRGDLREEQEDGEEKTSSSSSRRDSKENDSKEEEEQDKAFPYKEMGVLLVVGFSSSVLLTGLFPYVAYMVVDLGAADNVDEAGYMTGYVSSGFLFGRMLTAYYWGRVADKYGRLPVVYMACSGVFVLSLVFGLSVSIEMAILTRVMMGVLNPLSGLVKTLVSEICGPVYERRGMAMTTGSWTLGFVLGPAIGGALARPVVQYPGTFHEGSFFDDYPYFLPNLFNAFIGLIALVLAVLFLPETLKSKAKENSYSKVEDLEEVKGSGGVEDVDGDIELAVSDDNEKVGKSQEKSSGSEDDSPHVQTSFRDLLKYPIVAHLVTGYFLLSFVAVVYDEVVPLWALSSIHRGGLEYTSREVGQIMSIVGIPLMIFTFFGYPIMAKKWGEVKCFKVGQFMGAIMCLVTALLRYLPLIKECCDESEGDDDEVQCRCSHHDYSAWHSWVLQLLIVVCSSICHIGFVLAFTSLFLLTNRSVPSEKRAAVNGLAMTVGSISKTVGPILGSVAYAWSIHNGLGPPFNFLFVFFFCALLGIVTHVLFLPIKPSDAEQFKHISAEDTDAIQTDASEDKAPSRELNGVLNPLTDKEEN